MTVNGSAALTSDRTRLTGFVRLARLRFLLYNVLPVGLGVGVAVHAGYPIDIKWYVLAQLFAWVVHVMTHYCNEYYDLDADRANVYYTPWTGGSRALVDGLVKPEVSLGTAFVLWAAGGFLVAVMPTTEARLLGVVTIALAWFYTAPPLKLNYRGLGELTVAAELNVLWPVVAVVLQVGHVPAMLLAILAPTAVLQVARMMIMNLGDRVSDSSVGKRTLPVIIGYRPAVAVIIGAQLVAYAMLTLFAYVSWVPWTVWAAMAATAPLSAWLAAQLWGGRMRDVNPEAMTPVVFWASNHVSLIVGAAMLGVLVDAIQGGAQTSGLVILSCVLGAYGLLFGQRLWLAHARALVGAETGAGAPSSGAAPAPADAAFVDPDAAADLDTAADTHPPEAMSAPEEGPAGDPAASGVSASGETPSGDTANDRKPPAAPRQRSRTGGSADQRRASKSGA